MIYFISILETIFEWIAIIAGIGLACWVTYYILYKLAHQAASHAMEEREQKLQHEIEELKNRELKFKTDADQKREELLAIKKETENKEEKAKAILSNAEKLRETSETNVLQIKKENEKLRNELQGARARSKRLKEATAKAATSAVIPVTGATSMPPHQLQNKRQLEDNNKIKKQNRILE
jgi:hypothetical protein